MLLPATSPQPAAAHHCSQNNTVAYARKFGTTQMVETGCVVMSARFGFMNNGHAAAWRLFVHFLFRQRKKTLAVEQMSMSNSSEISMSKNDKLEEKMGFSL